jgi:hypothetical protein
MNNASNATPTSPEIKRAFREHKGVFHVCYWVVDMSLCISCCRKNFRAEPATGQGPSCIACAACAGCPACSPQKINPATIVRGPWRTQNGRYLYPYQMELSHLENTVRKLRRDQENFRGNWARWVEVFHTEIEQRLLAKVPGLSG